ncbi:MAG: PilZ domain-containing protein [Sphingobium sp.]|nr:PilZ domain-containing protein [Sphingobium sp.]
MARRAVARDIIDFHTVVAVEGNGAFDARLMDISPYGCQVRAYSRVLERGERIWVLLPGLGEVEGEAMWGLRGIFGCKFAQPVDSDLYAQLLPQLQGAHPGLNDPTA